MVNVYVEAPAWIVIIGLIVALAAIAGWGISESVWLAAVITVIEVGGLLFVIIIATQIETPQAVQIYDRSSSQVGPL